MRVAVLVATATVALAVLQAPAYAGDTPGTYTNYGFSGATGFSTVDFAITPEVEPGFGSNIYWSNQFGFTQGNGAYTGLQSNGGDERLFLFSVWDATEAKVGSAGSYCLSFGGEGEGKSCRMKYNWKAGDTFRFRVAHEGDRWFGVTVTGGGTSFKLGSIRAGSDKISPNGMVNWAEYFEWSHPASNCYDQPYTRARFALPVGDGKSATISGTDTSDGCASSSKVEAVSGGSVQTNAIGNSTRGVLKSGDLCAVPGGGKVVLGACRDHKDTTWVLAKDGSIRMAYGRCLGASGSAATVGDCGSPQKWTRESGRLKHNASGNCLDVPGSSSEVGTELIVYPCHSGANQKWTVPPTP